MSAAAAIPITSAGAGNAPFIRYRPDQAKLLGRGPAKLLAQLELLARVRGATFHCKANWLGLKIGYSEGHVLLMLRHLVKARALSTKPNGHGLWITLISQVDSPTKICELTEQNVRSETPASINLQEQEKPKNSSSTAAAENRAENTTPKISEMPDPGAVAELTKRGVWQREAQKLSRDFGKERVMAGIAYREQAEGVRYTPGFLVRAIREGWKIPESPPPAGPAMKTCLACGEFFNPDLEGWHDGKCLQCAENSERLRWPAGELPASMEGTHRQSKDRGETIPSQSDRTYQVQGTAAIDSRIDATVRTEPQLPVDASYSTRGTETKTAVSIARGRPAAVWEPKCRKCGLPITAEKLGTHGMHFACDEWSRG